MTCETCNNRQHSKSGFCLDHLPNKLRCTKTTNRGKRCRLPIVKGADVCNCHLQTMRRGCGSGKYGWIYLFDTTFKNETKLICKIGRSVNPNHRLGELTQGNPFGKILFSGFVGHNAKKIESKLHIKYSNCWIEREMFQLTQNQIQEIFNYLKNISSKFLGG